MDIQLVRGDSLRPGRPISVVTNGVGKHEFQKVFDEKSNTNTKDVYIKGEQTNTAELSQADKDDLKKKYNITNMDFYSKKADELFGKLRDLGLITEQEYMKTGNCPIFAGTPSKLNGNRSTENGKQDQDSNLFLAYRSIAAEHSQDYAEVGYEESKASADFNKKISQVLYNVFMS